MILISRVRSTRVFYAPPSVRQGASKGRGPRHGHKLSLNDPSTRLDPDYTSVDQLARCGQVKLIAFEGRHPKLDTRVGIADDHDKPVIIEGTVIRVKIQHLPGGQGPNRCGCWCPNLSRIAGGKWITGGLCTCAASIWNTPSGS